MELSHPQSTRPADHFVQPLTSYDVCGFEVVPCSDRTAIGLRCLRLYLDEAAFPTLYVRFSTSAEDVGDIISSWQ